MSSSRCRRTFSNELLDAMPVNLHGKLVVLRATNLYCGRDRRHTDEPSMLIGSICLSTKLERGFVIAVDYGFSRANS